MGPLSTAPGPVVRVLFTLYVLLFRLSPAVGDEYDEFALAKNAFDAGEYQEAVRRFDTLLTKGMQNPSLIIESHKFIAISYLFIGNETSAETHFNKLLTRAPDFTLDPLLYPIEVVDFFTKTKQKSKKQLEALAKAKAIEAQKQRALEAARQRAEAEKLRRNIYFEREVRKGSLLVALLPFGAGQFQNRKPVKGTLFLSAELLLGGAAMTFYFLHESLRDEASKPSVDSDRRDTLMQRERIFRIANFASIGALVLIAGIGVADALLQFKAETIVWKRVRESDVPDDMRHKPTSTSASLKLIPSPFGLSLSGCF